MNKIHDMNSSLIVGEKGENIIYNYLKQHKKISNIRDVRNLYEYRKKDIDYIIDIGDMKDVGIEIKTDTYNSPNIFYETFSCIETNSIGCLRKTKATYIFYYFLKTGELYILHTEAFNKWFDRNINNFTKKQLKNKRYNGVDLYTSEGYTIPKVFLENNFKMYQKQYLIA